MKVKSTVGVAVGPASNTKWGQILMLPGSYGIVEIEDDNGQAQHKGSLFLSSLGGELSREFSNLAQIEQVVDSVMTPIVRSLIVLVPIGTVVHIVLRKEGRVYVRRNNEIALLMDKQGAVSGEVRERDALLLASRGFSENLSTQDIVDAFCMQEPSDIAQKLTIALHNGQQSDGSVSLVYQVDAKPSDSPASVIPVKARRSYLNNIHMYVDKLRHVPNMKTKMIGMIITTLFVFSVTLGVIKQAKTGSNAELVHAFEEAQHTFDEGSALLELNPIKGRERLTQAKLRLDPFVEQINTRTKEGRDVYQLYQKISDNLTQSLQIWDVSPELFYDVSLLKKDATATMMARDGGTLLIVDAHTQTLYRLAIASKNASIVGGGASVKDVSAITMSADIAYMLTPQGILAFHPGEKTPKTIVEKDNGWGFIRAMSVFGGNIYLLDIGKSRIWKYVSVEKGFSDLREYLNPDALPDFSYATAMTIDGTVWVSQSVGRVFHFVNGKEETFIPKGVEPSFGADSFYYSVDDVTHIYVLDRATNRVVVLDKDGAYLAQYRLPANFHPLDMTVAEKEKKILFLTDGKIYSIDLK